MTEQQARDAGLRCASATGRHRRPAAGGSTTGQRRARQAGRRRRPRTCWSAATVVAPYGGEVLGMLATAVHAEVPRQHPAADALRLPDVPPHHPGRAGQASRAERVLAPNPTISDISNSEGPPMPESPQHLSDDTSDRPSTPEELAAYAASSASRPVATPAARCGPLCVTAPSPRPAADAPAPRPTAPPPSARSGSAGPHRLGQRARARGAPVHVGLGLPRPSGGQEDLGPATWGWRGGSAG